MIRGKALFFNGNKIEMEKINMIFSTCYVSKVKDHCNLDFEEGDEPIKLNPTRVSHRQSS